MIECDCKERIGAKINSWKQFEELKIFFDRQVEKGVFIETPVEIPYYIGYCSNGNVMKWYANKWYKCLACETRWELIFPDFPAQGSVRKMESDGYVEGK